LQRISDTVGPFEKRLDGTEAGQFVKYLENKGVMLFLVEENLLFSKEKIDDFADFLFDFGLVEIVQSREVGFFHEPVMDLVLDFVKQCIPLIVRNFGFGCGDRCVLAGRKQILDCHIVLLCHGIQVKIMNPELLKGFSESPPNSTVGPGTFGRFKLFDKLSNIFGQR
jgi:hypothetical protein